MVEINGMPLVEHIIKSLPLLTKDQCIPVFLIKRMENQKNYTGKEDVSVAIIGSLFRLTRPRGRRSLADQGWGGQGKNFNMIR